MLCAGALPLVRGFHACALVLERQHRQQTLGGMACVRLSNGARCEMCYAAVYASGQIS